MFTKKPVRNGTHSRQDAREYHKDFVEIIQPFEEADTDRQQRSGYMAELEAWLEKAVFPPIREAIASGDSKDLHLAFN